jgi:hypothetical protein
MHRLKRLDGIALALLPCATKYMRGVDGCHPLNAANFILTVLSMNQLCLVFLLQFLRNDNRNG